MAEKVRCRSTRVYHHVRFHKSRRLPAGAALASGHSPSQVRSALTCFAGKAYGSDWRFDGKRMSKLDAAIEKLERALAQLERAADMPKASVGKSQEWVKEREALLARVAELEDEVRSVSSINEEIETRLDSAMGEIRAALAH